MTDQPHRLARAVGQHMHKLDNAARAQGIVLEEIKPGYARMSMTVRELMLNSHGSCQGGVTFTLADAAFAYACNSYNQPAVALTCSITFPSPGRLGDMLTAVAEERHNKGRTGVYDVTVSNQDGEIVALFRGHSRRLSGSVLPE